VVWCEPSSILFEGQDDVILGVHASMVGDRSTIRAIVSFRELPLGSPHTNVLGSLVGLLDTTGCEDVLKTDACPSRAAMARRTPTEANGLLHHILFLATVACAYECAGYVVVREMGEELIHGKGGWKVDQAGDGEAVVVPVNLRDRTMIADIVERRWGDELFHESFWYRFSIEWVATSETDHVWMARDPFLCCVDRGRSG
jgi:hypothetical protein